ncbi:MAG: thioredoxin family protein [Eubacteriales bacterium]|nr:thioredoxin family protein [Eubacteriales bacterium]
MSHHLLNITRENYTLEVLGSKLPVLLSFWADWCVPCQVVVPKLEDLAEEFKDLVKCGVVNVDEQPEIVADLNIISLPTLTLSRNGVIVGEIYGVNSREKLRRLIKAKLK